MAARRSLALLLVILVPFLASCGDDEPSDSADGGSQTTETTAADATETTDDASDTTLPKVGFSEGVAQMNESLDAASGDVCALVASLSNINVADPTTPEEGKEAVGVVARYLDAIADAAPGQADALHKAADDFQAEAEAAGYDVTALSESEVMSSVEVGTALGEATAKCSGG